MHHPNCRLKVNTSTTITWTMSIHEWFWKCNYFMIDWSMINVCEALTIHIRYSQLCTQNDFEMLICIFFIFIYIVFIDWLHSLRFMHCTIQHIVRKKDISKLVFVSVWLDILTGYIVRIQSRETTTLSSQHVGSKSRCNRRTRWLADIRDWSIYALGCTNAYYHCN